MYRQQQISVSRAVRAVFGTSTLGFLALGFILDSDQLLAISGVCGIIWWIWDLFGGLCVCAGRRLAREDAHRTGG